MLLKVASVFVSCAPISYNILSTATPSPDLPCVRVCKQITNVETHDLIPGPGGAAALHIVTGEGITVMKSLQGIQRPLISQSA